MPNHVTNKIVFAAAHMPRVLEAIAGTRQVDFAKLIPMPAHVYCGSLGKEDQEDFKANWYDWSLANWGTKWNAYDCSNGNDGEAAWIQFDTAWNIPRPVIVAFANTLNIDFEHKYFDEGHNFWGVETWKSGNNVMGATRMTKRASHEDDFAPLCIELKGYDPSREDGEPEDASE